MSAKYEQILSLNIVTDHDCGNYEIGEIDVHSNPFLLEQYLENYGERGYNELAKSLISAGQRILEASRTVYSKKETACESAKVTR